MPARLTPDMPPRVAAAQRALSGPARLLVLRFVINHPESRKTEVVEATGLGTDTGYKALRELQHLGFVTVTKDAGTGPGANHRFSVDSERLTEDLAALVTWIMQPL
ncbi:hypothetical protein [Pseudolysinimonas sp.]|uniref:hypothetical protein n=1 Tax=Pseudolysinimonas sp. TaxID=2680009 RepID=UPI0032656320